MSEPLDRDFKIRIPLAMYKELERLATQRGPGTKIAPLIREAIYQVYLSGGSSSGTGTGAVAPTQPAANGPTERKIGFHAKRNSNHARRVITS
jgi:hypothetical protein